MASSKGTCLLIPGFLGSELTTDFGWLAEQLGAQAVWLSPTRLASGKMKDLAFQIDQNGVITWENTTLEDGLPLKAYYQHVYKYLVKMGWRVARVVADWRKPTVYDVGHAMTRIDELEDDWPLTILAHSRGGLMARHILAQLKAAGKSNAVSRVVACGTPHTGSMNAVTLYAGFHSLLVTLVKIGKLLGPDYLSGLLPKTIYATIRTWPSGYELLPAPGAPWLKGTPAATFYDPATYEGSPMDPIAALMTNALAGWADVPAVPDGFDWTDGYGTGTRTPVGVKEVGVINSPEDLVYTTSGDGTVASVSATGKGRKQIQYPCVHDQLLIDDRAWPAIESALSGTLEEDLTVISGTILQSG